MYYIIESNIDKSVKQYKCPFCNFRGTKEKLVVHIENEHKEMIPKDYTAARVLFNYFNKKDHGTCVVDKKETKWNEETWRYDRFCGEDCKQIYVKEFKKVRMVNKYGVEHLLNNVEQQKKMLSNRSISGEYKFKDGGIRSYCGSYEMKLLQFYDKVLNVHSSDIITPGPVFEYEYNGKTLQWITDVFYIPMNLIHDVKDGGDNPNNREMTDYREKQDAKEDMIKKLNTYNYIRLTDNNFEQLFLILAEIKEDMMENEGQKDYVIHINEDLSMMAGALPQGAEDDSLYLVKYDKGYNSGYCVAKSPTLDRIITIDDDQHLKLESYEFLHGAKYSVYKYDSTEAFQIWGKLLSDYSSKAFARTKDYFYNKITGKQLLKEDQIDYDIEFEQVVDIYAMHEAIMNFITINIENGFKERLCFECVNQDIISALPKSIIARPEIKLMESVDGYFLMNENNRTFSEIFKDVLNFPGWKMKLIG